MINSVYGKTMENLRKKINVRLISNAEDFLKYISKPTHITHKIFGKDYAAIYETKPVLILNKPINIGFTVVDLRKWKMYDFHYNFIKKSFDAEVLLDTKWIQRIQSKKHKLGTYEIDKISLSSFDDKRYVLDDLIHTLAYFYKNSVTSCEEIQKDRDDWKRSW